MIEHLGNLQININLIHRITEIYEATENVVRIEGVETDIFWTTKGVRQGCPLSPLLFSIFLSDIEFHLSKGQTGGCVVGKKKFWSLAYADDLVIVAKTKEEFQSLIKRLENYLEKKKLILNADKTKIIRFTKAKGREPEEKFFWKGIELENVRKIKYLGFTFQKNGNYTEHVRDLSKKANIALAQVWGISQRKFKENFQLRMLLFDKLVASILWYGAEIWGWKEYADLEKIQYKYIRWTLGVSQKTPNYLLLEEAKRFKLSTESSRRAILYEEKISNSPWKILVHNCFSELVKKELGKKNDWEEARAKFYESNGFSSKYINGKREEGYSVREEVLNRYREVQLQERRGEIIKSRSNPRYQNIMTFNLPEYLKGCNKHYRMVAGFRLGKEEKGNEYWRCDDERRCRICSTSVETIEHLARDCTPVLFNNKSSFSILHDARPDIEWMKKLTKLRHSI